MSTNETALERARTSIAEGDPTQALTWLEPCDDPESHWLRAVCAAHMADPLRTAIALRAAQRGGSLPDDAVLDTARPLSDAVLEDTPSLRCWVTLGAAVLPTLRNEPAQSPLHLAWEIAVAAATRLDQHEDDALARAGLVLTLGTLQWRMGRAEEATQLLRGAQDAGEAVRDAAVFRGATLVLAEIALAEDDDELAEAIVKHGCRKLERLGGDPTITADGLLTAYKALCAARLEAQAT